MHFFHFSDTCNLGSNGSTKILESLLSLIPFWKATLALVLESYESGTLKTDSKSKIVSLY
jgi:hypothetical protein